MNGKTTLTPDERKDFISNYLLASEDTTLEIHQASLHALEKISMKELKKLRQVEGRLSKLVYPDYSTIDWKFKMKFLAVISFLKEYDKLSQEFEFHSWDEMLKVTSKALSLLRSNQKMTCLTVNYDKDLKAIFASNPEFTLIRKNKKRLQARLDRIIGAHTVHDILPNLRNELVSAGARFDSLTHYSPPSVFDGMLSEYLLRSPLKNLIPPTIRAISHDSIENAFDAISSFVRAIDADLGITVEIPESIIYCSTIRFLFDEAYFESAELSKYHTANIEFLIKATAYASRTVREVELSDFITKNYTPGLPIASLFSSKQFQLLEPMQRMTNPIDLVYHVHGVLQSLAQYFASSEGFIPFEDTMTLLLSVISLNPPTNAVAIAKFIDRWGSLVPSSSVTAAKTYFYAAVDLLVPLKNVVKE